MSKYCLVAKQESNRNKFTVTIKADSNDGDYITSISTYTKNVFDEYVIDELIHLKQYSDAHQLENYKPNGVSEYLDIPYNGWDGYCHTLEYAKVEYTDENGMTWKVEY